MSLAERRDRSIDQAARLGCQIPTHLPLPDEPVLRPEEAVAARALVGSAVASAAYGWPTGRARHWVRAHGLDPWLTDQERAFLASDGSDPEFIRQLDLPESLWTLVWALKLVDAIDLGEGCPDTLVTIFPDLKSDEGPDGFLARTSLRAVDEIADVEDLAYVLDWWRIDHLLRGEPAMALPGIGARRRALGWLITTEDWDAVPLDT